MPGRPTEKYTNGVDQKGHTLHSVLRPQPFSKIPQHFPPPFTKSIYVSGSSMLFTSGGAKKKYASKKNSDGKFLSGR